MPWRCATPWAGCPRTYAAPPCRGAHRALAERRTEVEQLLVLETGKPLVDCRTEVDRTLLTLQTSAEEVARLHGETVPLDLLPSGEGLIGFWVRKPVGVVVGIAGYNYPLLLAAHKVAPALAAGCPVVLKPAPQTPLATLWMVHVLREALVAAGGPGGRRPAGHRRRGRRASRLTTDPRLGAVSFTGSAAVGHQIARDAAPTKVLLELGSNAAVVVAEDADLDAAADAVIRGGYYASGQACISVQRVIVTEPVRDELVKRLAARIGEVVVGDPRERGHPGLGADRRALHRAGAGLGRARGRRRRPAAGRRDGRATACSRRPCCSTCPTAAPRGTRRSSARSWSCASVPDLDAAFEAVNASRYGLHASVFTGSLDTAFSALDRLDVGGVVVNEVPGFRSDVMPYGGTKDSGIGREGPRFAIEELTVTRMAVIRPSTRKD